MAWLLVHDLGSVSISDRIRAFLEYAFPQPEIIQLQIDLINNALEAYDICRQNRNQYTHFALEHDPEAQKVMLLRQQKGPGMKRAPFPTELGDMRRVAEEIIGLNNHLHLVNNYIFALSRKQPATLPSRVALPELLSTPHPQVRTEPGPQRPPSVLRLTEEEWIAKYRKEKRPLPDEEQPKPS